MSPATELHEVGDGCWAYLQEDGSWGWSNAGLVTDGERSLLVDTLYDLQLTAAMLDTLRDATDAARQIDTLVNTHANGDHTYGNQLVSGATIVSSAETAAEFADVSPATMQRFVRGMGLAARLPWPLSAIPVGHGVTLGELGSFFHGCFGRFDYSGIRLTAPDETFEGEARWTVGDREVHFVQVGPAHTRGDTLVHVPDARVVYTGDILFQSGHPVAWEGPVQGWIGACDRILAMDVDVVVPGHGQVTDKDAVRRLRTYLTTLHDAARARFDAGMGVLDAARDISLDAFGDLGEAERIVINVDTLYREFSGTDARRPPFEQWVLMTAMRKAR